MGSSPDAALAPERRVLQGEGDVPTVENPATLGGVADASLLLQKYGKAYNEIERNGGDAELNAINHAAKVEKEGAGIRKLGAVLKKVKEEAEEEEELFQSTASIRSALNVMETHHNWGAPGKGTPEPALEPEEVSRLNHELAELMRQERLTTGLVRVDLQLMGDLLAPPNDAQQAGEVAFETTREPLDAEALIAQIIFRKIKKTAKDAVLMSKNRGQGAAEQIHAAFKSIDVQVAAQKHQADYHAMKKMASALKGHLSKAIQLKVALQSRVSKLANTDKFCALHWFRALQSQPTNSADLCGDRRKAAAAKGQLLTIEKYSQAHPASSAYAAMRRQARGEADRKLKADQARRILNRGQGHVHAGDGQVVGEQGGP